MFWSEKNSHHELRQKWAVVLCIWEDITLLCPKDNGCNAYCLLVADVMTAKRFPFN